MSLYAFWNSVSISAIFSLLALGVYLSFRIMRFPDLTCDGSYALGACSSAALVRAGFPAYCTPVAAFAIGFVAGWMTGAMYTKLKFPAVVAGIIMMTAAYSLDLLMMRVPNRSIEVDQTLYASIERWVRQATMSEWSIRTLVYPMLFVSIAGIAYLIWWGFLRSEMGLRWRCVGVSSQIASRNGINVDATLPIALGFANGLIAIAGSLFAHFQRFADVNMGVGIIMVGLASVFLGQALESIHLSTPLPSLARQVLFVFIGTAVYRFVVAYAYELGFPTSVFNLVTSGFVFLALLLPSSRTVLTQAFTRK